MNIFNLLRRPEYVFHPVQIVRRIARRNETPPEIATVTLPWRAKISARIKENVGAEIYYYGIFDRIVPEAIWRLMDRGETGLDIGANSGQNTSAMAVRSGRMGRVIAFEPHPLTFSELQENIANLEGTKCAPVTLENVALGNKSGKALLSVPRSYDRGSAALVSGYDAAKIAAEEKSEATSEPAISEDGCVKVEVRTLDSFVGNVESIGVCKIDVEGHELQVLEGASSTLSRKIIRDVIFEDFNPMPSPVARLLQSHGYSIFQMSSGWLKPGLKPILEGGGQVGVFTFNYLATIDPQRAVRRFQVPGWRCLMNL